MTALLITAVVNGTDTLTVVGHGLVTGDGPAAVRNLGDGLLPAPLAAVTDYWIIRLDADTFKLADSSANALLGTAINLTTNGTGTNYLEIGIPFRRARTYAVGSQVKKADLNAIQDSLTALHALLTDQAQSVWPYPTVLRPDTCIIFPRPHVATNWAFDGDVSADPAGLTASLKSSGAGDADFCLSDYMRKGQTLTGVRLWLMGDGTVDVGATVYRHEFDNGVVAGIGTGGLNNIDNTTNILDIDSSNTKFANEFTRLWLRVHAYAAGAQLQLIILVFA